MCKKVIPFEDWKKVGEEKFNTDDVKQFRFQCPNCKETQRAQDFIDAKVEGASQKFFFSCIGRWVENRGCKWTLGGLLQIHQTEVVSTDGNNVAVFEFAE